MEEEPPNGLPTGIHLSTGAGHVPVMFARVMVHID